MVIEKTVRPSWLNSVPKNYGDAKAGSIKADEWRTLSTVFFPIALITLWGDDDGSAPPESSFLMKALDHTMALFQATILACRRSMTVSRASAYRKYISDWVNGLRTLFPHTHKGKIRPNIHAAGHIYDFLLLFGPVKSWWCFPFECLIGALQKINTNDHVGGMSIAIMLCRNQLSFHLFRCLGSNNHQDYYSYSQYPSLASSARLPRGCPTTQNPFR